MRGFNTGLPADNDADLVTGRVLVLILTWRYSVTGFGKTIGPWSLNCRSCGWSELTGPLLAGSDIGGHLRIGCRDRGRQSSGQISGGVHDRVGCGVAVRRSVFGYSSIDSC